MVALCLGCGSVLGACSHLSHSVSEFVSFFSQNSFQEQNTISNTWDRGRGGSQCVSGMFQARALIHIGSGDSSVQTRLALRAQKHSVQGRHFLLSSRVLLGGR